MPTKKVSRAALGLLARIGAEERLTKHHLSVGHDPEITSLALRWLRVRGLAEKWLPKGHNQRHQWPWRLTPAGRALLAVRESERAQRGELEHGKT